MSSPPSVLAADIGAGSVKVFLVALDGDRILTKEVDRFPNSPLVAKGHIYNDVDYIYGRLKQGLARAIASIEPSPLSVGVDTFGNDYALLDGRDELIGMPYSYRDPRTSGAEDMLTGTRLASRRARYGITGIVPSNATAYSQLLADAAESGPALRDRAATFLMLPDLLGFFLSGEKSSEYVTVSASALVDVASRRWSEPILSSIPAPRSIFTEIVSPGTPCGIVNDPALASLSTARIDLVKVAGHDSGSAIVPLPLATMDAIYISSGSWSLLGVETDRPLASEEAFEAGFSNQGLPEGRYRFQKAIPGLWILQQCLKEWQAGQPELSFADLERQVDPRNLFRSFIDVEQPQFSQPGGMIGKIRDYCRVTGQKIPGSISQIVNCVYSSLVLKYKTAATALERILGHDFAHIVVAGGGAHAFAMCSMVAAATAKPVMAGLGDASALGNGLIQLIAHGHLANVAQAREAVADSFHFTRFEPGQSEPWDAAAATAMQLEERYRDAMTDAVRTWDKAGSAGGDS